MQSDLARAWKQFKGFTCLYVIQCILLVTLFLGLLHIVNVFPRYYAPNVRLKEEALSFLSECENNPAIRQSRYVACNTAASDAAVNVRLLSLEQALYDIIRHFMWQPHSTLNYVLIKTIDNLLGSSVLLFCVFLVILLWLLWTFVSGPLRAYRNYLFMQEQGHQPKVKDVAVDLMYKKKTV